MTSRVVLLISALTCLGAAAEERLSVSPADLRPGGTRQVVLSFQTGQANDVHFAATRGELSAVVRTPNGYETTLTLPKESYPHVVLVSAQSAIAEPAFAAIRVWGRGVADVASAPRRKVVVRVAGTDFGPVTTDSKGRARVPVEVPPGVDSAECEGRTIPLGAPLTPRAFAAVSPRSIGSDGGALRVFAVAVNPTGEWLPAAETVELVSPAGTFSAPVAQGPRVVSQWQVAPTQESKVSLIARVRGAQASSAVLLVEVKMGRASRVAISAPAALTVGETAVGAVQVQLFDRFDRPALSTPTISGTGLTIGPARAVGPGSFVADVTAGTTVDNEAGRIAVRADDVETSAAVAVKAGPTTQLRTSWSGVLIADGRPLTLNVVALDAFGNMTADEISSPAARTVQRGPDGSFVLTVEARADEAGELVVPLRAGAHTTLSKVSLRREGARYGLSADAAVLTNFADVVAPTVGARGGVWPTAAWGGALDLRASTFSSSLEQARSDTQSLSVSPLAAWRTKAAGLWLQVLAGPELCLLRTSSRLGLGPVLEDGGATAGLRASVNLSKELGPGQGFIELSGGQRFAAALMNLNGPLTWVGLGAGYRYDAY